MARFDLGRYPRGDAREIRLDRPGIVSVFCEVHEFMRAVIVAGVRTPFARAGSVFKDLSAIDLGEIAVRELMDRTGVPGEEMRETWLQMDWVRFYSLERKNAKSTKATQMTSKTYADGC